MTLSEWLTKPGNTSSKLADQTGVDLATISRVHHGLINCTLRVAMMIDAGTNGEIDALTLAGPEDRLLIQAQRGWKKAPHVPA